MVLSVRTNKCRPSKRGLNCRGARCTALSSSTFMWSLRSVSVHTPRIDLCCQVAPQPLRLPRPHGGQPTLVDGQPLGTVPLGIETPTVEPSLGRPQPQQSKWYNHWNRCQLPQLNWWDELETHAQYCLQSSCPRNATAFPKLRHHDTGTMCPNRVSHIGLHYDGAGPAAEPMAHATRSRATSWAALRGVSLEKVCAEASWTSPNTVARFC